MRWVGCWAFEIVWSHLLVMRRGVMFGVVIGHVGTTRGPNDAVLVLVDAILDPVVAHVDGTGSLLLDSIVGDTDGCGVVGVDECGCLGVAHVEEGLSNDNAFFGVDKECADFGFGSGGGNVAEDTSEAQDGSVESSGVIVVAKEEVATSTTAGFGFVEVAGVAVNDELHIAGTVYENGVRVSVAVVKELVDRGCGSFGGTALFGGEVTECDEEGAVDGASVIEEGADDLLDALDFRR